ncbi:MAG TPA: acyl carrier protein [Bacillota bacterium]|nr:acyl carrier protein [Bacillota bacterium]
MDIQADLIGYIATLGKIPREDLDPQVKIYNSGIISSLKLLELMTYIEKQYRIVIKPEELIEANFKDIGTIIHFIESKIKG